MRAALLAIAEVLALAAPVLVVNAGLYELAYHALYGTWARTL